MKLEMSAASAAIGLSILQPLSFWRDAAPSLADLRTSPMNDYKMRQLLLDADLYGGVAVLLIGGTAAIMTQQMFPLLLAACGILLVSLYHRSVLASPSPVRDATPEDSNGNGNSTPA